MNKQEMELRIKQLAKEIASENPNLIEDVNSITQKYFIPEMEKPIITPEEELTLIQQEKEELMNHFEGLKNPKIKEEIQAKREETQRMMRDNDWDMRMEKIKNDLLYIVFLICLGLTFYFYG
jgi:hypothetical protein